MKKLNSILCGLVLALALVLLVGCVGKSGVKPSDMSNSPYVGTWKVTSLQIADEEVPADEALEDDIILVLNADGTATLTSDTSADDGAWSDTDSGIKLEGDNLNVEFKDDNGALVADIFFVKMKFERQ